MKPIITHLLSGVKTGSIIFVLLAALSPLKAFSNNSPSTIGDDVLPVELVTKNEALMGFSLSISNATIQKGGEFCAQVKVAGFVDIIGLEFLLKFDSTRLTFKEVKNFNLTGLTSGTMGLPGAGSNPTGTLKVSWLDNNVTGITLADGTAIFDICFTAVNVDATTNIRFVYKEVFDKNENNVAINNSIPQTVITIGAGGTGGGGSGGVLALDLTDATATAANQEVCIKANAVSGFTNLKSAQFTINYNTAQLNFSSVKNFNLAGLTQGSFTTTTPGTIAVNWTSTTPVTGNSLTNGVAIVDLCFTGKSAGISSTVSFAAGAQIQNKDNQAVSLNGTTGVITVNAPPTTGPATFDITDVTATGVGQQVCQKVNATNFTNLLSTEYTITYNATQLDFLSVKNFNLNGLVDANFSKPGVGGTPLGSLKVSWNDPQVNTGVSVPNGTTIFEVCFTTKLNNITSTVTFGANKEIINKDQQEVAFVGQAGTVTVGTGGSGGPSNFILDLSDATVPATNQEVCIKVNANGGFTNINGLEFTINYNSTQLDFSAVKNFNLSGLTDAAFGLPGVGGNPVGSIKVAWFDQTAAGVSIANGTAIFDVCFKAKLPNITSMVTFATSPPPEAIDKDNTQLPFTGTSGQITVGGTTNSTDLVLKVSSASGATNSDVCLELSTTNFKNVLGMQYEIKFDPAFLTHKSFDNLNTSLRGFSTGGLNVNNTTGTIFVVWVDEQVTGVTLPDNAVIMRMCFTIKGTTGSSIVGINKSKTIELTDADEKAIPTQTQDGTVSIAAANAPTIVSPAVITNVPCFGESKGSINIDVRGGTGSYSYKWSNNATTQDLTNLAAGSYSVTVTDSGNATTVTGNFTVTQPGAALAITGITKTDANCFGQASGALDAAVTGGTTPLTYAWSGNLAAIANPTNVPAGNYTLTVTDANGCRAVSNPTAVAQPAAALNATTSTQPAKCDGAATGSATITATGGTSPYTYKWATNQTTNQLSNIAPGIYGFTVTDAKNCTFSGSVTVAQEQSVRITSIDPVNFDQNMTNGAINIAITGGVAPYKYSWAGPGSFVASTEDINNLGTAGQYCVTVTDNVGCTATMCANIVQRLKVNLTVTEACFGQATGGVSLQATGGVGPYTYKWSANNATTQNISNIAAGNYNVTVTDSQNNTVTGNATVPALTEIKISRTITDVNFVGGANGAISLTVTGGKPGYTYKWNNNSTAAALTGLVVGEYCVTITDLVGCSATGCFKVELVVAPLSVGTEITNNLCNGQNTGIARLQVSGGVGPYALAFNNGQPENLVAGAFERKNLAAGMYTYKVTDSRNTVIDGSITITQPAPLAISSFALRHDSEEPGCTGSIALSITGGTPGYQVSWNSPNVGFQIINLCEGNFIPSVIDANGCRKTFEPIALTSFTLSTAVKNTSCPEDQDGGIDLTLIGGSAPYRYAWLSARGDTLSKSQDLVDIAAGVYRLVVRENSGNRIEKQITVTTASRLTANIQILSSYNGFAVSCPTAKDGSVRASGLNGGGNGYVYEWLQNNRLVAATQNLNNAGPGSYVVRITDGLGCSVEEEVELLAPDSLDIEAFITDVSCIGSRDGEITAQVAGGVAGGRFTYAWNNGRSTPRVSGLTKGSYTITVTDRNNCTLIKSYEIKEPNAIAVQVQSINATEGCNGQALAVATGGVKPYSYRWNAPVTSSDSIVKSLCPGEYFVQVTDARGCKSTPEVSATLVKDRRLPCMDIRAVISPDGDGSNEEFLINCIQEFPGNRLFIYNRWGQLVFQAENYNNDWNGVTQSGEPLPEGAYYYILEYKNSDGKDIQAKGSITLLRDK